MDPAWKRITTRPQRSGKEPQQKPGMASQCLLTRSHHIPLDINKTDWLQKAVTDTIAMLAILSQQKGMLATIKTLLS